MWPSWFLTIGHVLVKIKTWLNAPTVKIRVNVLPVNVTSCSPKVFCSLRIVLNGNTICSGQEEHQKDNLTWNEDANQLETQMQVQIEPVARTQMDLQYFSIQQNKNAAKIFLSNQSELAKIFWNKLIKIIKLTSEKFHNFHFWT